MNYIYTKSLGQRINSFLLLKFCSFPSVVCFSPFPYQVGFIFLKTLIKTSKLQLQNSCQKCKQKPTTASATRQEPGEDGLQIFNLLLLLRIPSLAAEGEPVSLAVSYYVMKLAQ